MNFHWGHDPSGLMCRNLGHGQEAPHPGQPGKDSLQHLVGDSQATEGEFGLAILQRIQGTWMKPLLVSCCGPVARAVDKTELGPSQVSMVDAASRLPHLCIACTPFQC
jgi:hypothetical protein